MLLLSENRSGRTDSYKIMSSDAGNTTKALGERKWRSGVSVVFGLLCGTLLLGNERIKRISKNMSSFCLLIFRKAPSHSKWNPVYLLLQKDEHLHETPTGRSPSRRRGSICAFEIHAGTEINLLVSWWLPATVRNVFRRPVAPSTVKHQPCASLSGHSAPSLIYYHRHETAAKLIPSNLLFLTLHSRQNNRENATTRTSTVLYFPLCLT